jgi:L-threonylcarbamoyladenylate synthase
MNKIDQAVSTLKSGGVILHPTDTIWGLACDPFNENAIAKVQQIKQRPQEQPFILLVSSIEILKEYVDNIHPRIETLLSLHERPLTIIYPNVKMLKPPLTNEKGGAAIRIVSKGPCKELLDSWGAPLLSTSANIHGSPTPAHFGEISSEIIRQSDFTFPFERSEKTAKMQKTSAIAKYHPKTGELDFIRE